MQKIIFLVGAMGVGKTSLGRGVCEILGIPFFDTDEMAVENIRVKNPNALRSLLSFASAMNAELPIVARQLEDIAPPAIIATGGEFPLNPACAAYMLKLGVIINITRLTSNVVSTFEQERAGTLYFTDCNTGEKTFLNEEGAKMYAMESEKYKCLSKYEVANDGSFTEGVEALSKLIKDEWGYKQ